MFVCCCAPACVCILVQLCACAWRERNRRAQCSPMFMINHKLIKVFSNLKKKHQLIKYLHVNQCFYYKRQTINAEIFMERSYISLLVSWGELTQWNSNHDSSRRLKPYLILLKTQTSIMCFP